MADKLYVSTDKLSLYGKNLNRQSVEFKTIRKTMKSIVDDLNSSWGGVDAKKFNSNANEYLDNLETIENALDYYGYKVQRKSGRYDRRCSDFYNCMMKGDNNGVR